MVPEPLVEQAIQQTEAVLRRPLTSGQAAAVRTICAEGRCLSLVLGVAGAGKTTAIRCVADAYAAAGFTVVGTATSGQATRTLGREADIESRTLASVFWRLDHHILNLTRRHVVVLDEAGMTDDPAMLRLLTACELAGSKVVLVGDHRQLGPVGPGGALRALLTRHAGQVHVLDENIRQYDPEERAALAQLRRGDVGAAVRWYADHDRIRTAPDRDAAIRAMVDAWAADTGAGHDTAMYAWRRSNVEELNRHARTWMALNDRLSGPDLRAPGGAHYSAGDRIVTLAPTAGGKVVTSEHGVVEAVDRRTRSLDIRMDAGGIERLSGDELGPDRLAHAYAITVHRSQASTVDRAHRLEDGGGRDLAYVSMSRARQINTVHVVADDLDQAVEDLTRDWTVDRRARWAIDTGAPSIEPVDVEQDTAAPAGLREALRLGRLQAHRQAIEMTLPVDQTDALQLAEIRLEAFKRARRELEAGRGRYAHTPEGEAARGLNTARSRRENAEHSAAEAGNWRTRRHWRKTTDELARREATAQDVYDAVALPEGFRLDQEIERMEQVVDDLRTHQQERDTWLRVHPNAVDRLEALEQEVNPLREMPPIHQELSRLLAPRRTPEVGAEIDHGPDLGIDIGL
ncbi:MAG: ATP-dependent DNA helicase [Acidimicrobiia bacterium]